MAFIGDEYAVTNVLQVKSEVNLGDIANRAELEKPSVNDSSNLLEVAFYSATECWSRLACSNKLDF